MDDELADGLIVAGKRRGDKNASMQTLVRMTMSTTTPPARVGFIERLMFDKFCSPTLVEVVAEGLSVLGLLEVCSTMSLPLEIDLQYDLKGVEFRVQSHGCSRFGSGDPR